jgi:IS1 family transposase
MANVLSRELRLRVLSGLVDGVSVRAISRMTGVHQDTISRFALRMGEGCERLHNRLARDLTCTLIQVDEQWGFVLCKEKRVKSTHPPGSGEAYTFVALDANSRLVIAWRVGKRTEETCSEFIADVRARLLVVPQITSDGYAPYVSAIAASFGNDGVHYGQTIKNYTRGGRRDDDYRYEPPRQPFITKRAFLGTPDVSAMSTSYIERDNLTTRHTNGRMRRLCLAFSKRIENHRAAMALTYVHRNLCHINRTLRVTSALQAGLTDHVWDLAELMDAALAEAEPTPISPKPLEHREPNGTARQLPNGRGWLRVVS